MDVGTVNRKIIEYEQPKNQAPVAWFFSLNGDSPDNLDPIVNEAIKILNNLKKTDKAKKSALEMLRQI